MRLLTCWVVLVLLSVGTVMSGAAGLWWVVIVAAVAKAWVITDGFMELRQAPWGWRVAMLAWPVVLVAAMVVCQPKKILPDPPPSQASHTFESGRLQNPAMANPL